MKTFVCEHLLTSAGWLSPGALQVDAAGTITSVTATSPDTEGTELKGFVVPAMPNLHSHAFQRALCGRTEHRAPDRKADSFWTWRTAMYDLALRIGPEDLGAIAAQLYAEMLQAGMSSVGEFQYLHHAPDGACYDNPAEMSLQLLEAARSTGIAMTMLPVAYLDGGFGLPPTPQQRRFTCASPDQVLALRQGVQSAAQDLDFAEVGLAPHSLRAVNPESMQSLLHGLHTQSPQARVHIHVAEQTLEVQDSLAHLGQRPVRWLLDNCAVDERWCLVHATHLDPTEIRDLAQTQAVVGLCPSTEANLGDGIFSGQPYLHEGGRFGIGSDSHVTVSASDELRLFEYSQRLSARQRNLLIGPQDETQTHIGHLLWTRAAQGGAQALGQNIGALAVGRRADFVLLNPEHPRLAGHGPDTALDALVFGAADGAIDRVYVGGKLRVEDGRHIDAAGIRSRFTEAMKRLYG